jgi:hypothetical protein
MTKISELRHRVALCTSADVITVDGGLTLTRTPIVWCWAAVWHWKNLPSFISRQSGHAIVEGAARQTHTITVRAGLALDYTSAAWVYEERRKGQPRWYKILGFTDGDGPWIELAAKLMEKSDTAVAPAAGLFTPSLHTPEL